MLILTLDFQVNYMLFNISANHNHAFEGTLVTQFGICKQEAKVCCHADSVLIFTTGSDIGFLLLFLDQKVYLLLILVLKTKEESTCLWSAACFPIQTRACTMSSLLCSFIKRRHIKITCILIHIPCSQMLRHEKWVTDGCHRSEFIDLLCDLHISI